VESEDLRVVTTTIGGDFEAHELGAGLGKDARATRIAVRAGAQLDGMSIIARPRYSF